jgi:hypothetical protein
MDEFVWDDLKAL